MYNNTLQAIIELLMEFLFKIISVQNTVKYGFFQTAFFCSSDISKSFQVIDFTALSIDYVFVLFLIAESFILYFNISTVYLASIAPQL